MQPPGYLRSLYSFKGLRFRQRRKLIDKNDKKIHIRPRKNRYIDRSMKRGEKHQFRLTINSILLSEI